MACECLKSVVDKPIMGQKFRLKLVDSSYRVGLHTSWKGSFLNTVNDGNPTKVRQVYLHDRYSIFDVQEVNSKDKEEAVKIMDERCSNIYIHCPKSMNLARADGDRFLNSCMAIVKKQTDIIRGMPGGCVLHIGNGKRGGTIATDSRHINELNLQRNNHNRVDSTLFLENAAGQGNDLGRSWEELRHLFEGIDSPGVGLCLDTQHLFAGGMCDFANHESVVKLFDQVEAISPKIKPLFHLNDSKRKFDARVDRHESITNGFVWGGKELRNNQYVRRDEGLRSLLARCKEKSIDLVLETKTALADLKFITNNYCSKDPAL